MTASERLSSGDLVLDLGSREALLRGTPLRLTRLEFDLLAYLLRRKDRAVKRQELLDEIWGEGYSPESNVVDVVVASLRRKLGDDRRRPRYIVTVPGVGYRVRTEAGIPRTRRWRLYSLVPLAAGGLAAGLILAFGVTGSDEGAPGQAVGEDGSEIALVVESRSTQPPTLSGDCRSADLTLSDWRSAGRASGDLAGTVESEASGSLFSTAGCLAGAAKTRMVLVDQSGDRLEMVADSTFSLVALEPLPAPSAIEGSDILTVTGGTGRFANATGYGTCQTTVLIDYGGSPSSLSSASRSHCRLTLVEAGAFPAQAALSVRLVANPDRVSLVGSADPVRPSASYALVLYRNDGQRDLRDLTLTLLPVEGAALEVSSRLGDGAASPPIRTWRLPDLRKGERQVFDFSVRFGAAEGGEVPLVVELSSPDLEEPARSEPFLVRVE